MLDHENFNRKNHNKHLRRTIAKAKRDGLEIPKLKIATNLTNDQAIEYERAFIAAIGRWKHGGPLVNQTDGGEGRTGFKFSEKARAQMSRKRKGRAQTPEHRAAIKAGMSTPESKARQSAAQKKRFEREEERQKARDAKAGWYPSEAMIEAGRLFHTGRTRPPETGANISAAHKRNGHKPPSNKGRKNSEESIERMRIAAKARAEARRNNRTAQQ